MKIFKKYIWCFAVLYLCGCSKTGTPNAEQISISEIFVNDEAVFNMVTTTIKSSEETLTSEPATKITNNDTKTTCLSTEVNEDEIYFSKVFEYIDHRISWGSFYDFDKDGFPELVEITDGTYDGAYSFYIHNIKGDDFYCIGQMSVDTSPSSVRNFSLYMDDNSGELFYISDLRTIFWGTEKNDEVRINTYKFSSNTIEKEEIGFYCYKYDPTDPYSDTILVGDNYFMDNHVETGYYDKYQLSSNLGIDEYLSQFKKIEDVNIETLWCDSDWDNIKSIVIESLKEWL